jgi:hypothetical protein
MRCRLLSLENLRDANVVFEKYLEAYANKGSKVEGPMINFLRFLLLTLEVIMFKMNGTRDVIV